MNKIKLSDPKKIPEFLNEIKVTHNARMMAGKGLSEDDLVQKLLEKLPASMSVLKRLYCLDILTCSPSNVYVIP
jgi:hypothetical protein